MPIYLHDIPLSQAQARLQDALEQAGLWQMLGVEEIPLDEKALGRVLADAGVGTAFFTALSCLGDGWLCAARGRAQPALCPLARCACGWMRKRLMWIPAIRCRIGPTRWCRLRMSNRWMKQAPLPPIRATRCRSACARRSPPWTHVRPMGEDIVATELVLPAGHILRPVDLGAVAASGHSTAAGLRAARGWRSCPPEPSWCRLGSR